MFQLKKEYLTGIDSIDEQHRKLFEIANHAYELLNDEFIPDKYDNIIEVIKELKAYAVQHFADEEAYMESIDYKRRFSHKIEHVEFVEKVNGIDLDEIDENQEQIILDLLNFLTDWLVHHILENDVLIGK